MSWWADKLSGTTPTTHRVPPMQPSRYGGQFQAPANSQVNPEDEPWKYARPGVTTESREQSKCPGCGGGRYYDRGRGEPGGTVLNVNGQRGTAMATCFDCGYPRDNQFSGAHGAGGDMIKTGEIGKSAGVAPTPESFKTGNHQNEFIAKIDNI